MRALLVGLGVVGFFGVLVLASMREARVECEVCIVYGPGRECRVAAAVDRESAVRAAVASACSVLSDGVTRGLECDRTPPQSVRCEGG